MAAIVAAAIFQPPDFPVICTFNCIPPASRNWFVGRRFRCYDLAVLRERSQHPAPAVARETGGCYNRKDVCRLLKIDARQLKSWERQQLIPELTEYRFWDLLALKQIARLRSENANPRLIRQAIEALRTHAQHSPEPVEDVRVYKDGRRVRIQIGKQKMEPASGQLVFDFAEGEISKLLQLPPVEAKGRELREKLRQKLEADRWFELGLELEQTGGPYERIIEAYKTAADLDPSSAGALVNLGTVYFNGHAWADAENYYQKALGVDSEYPLAHFNLGNLYDERGDAANALHHYQEALRLQPGYADVHYNLALLHQGQHDLMRAVRHWKAYLKLDGQSAWAEIARRELAKVEAQTVVRGSRPAGSQLHVVKRENG
ncbi:MAG: tetratricopeptide repeat protein [Bryobacteraceae bacterium]